jgi:hypothetical protein
MELPCKGRGAWGLALGVKVGGRRLGQLRQKLSQVSALRPTTWRVGATTGQVSAAHGPCFIEAWPNLDMVHAHCTPVPGVALYSLEGPKGVEDWRRGNCLGLTTLGLAPTEPRPNIVGIQWMKYKEVKYTGLFLICSGVSHQPWQGYSRPGG